MLIKIRSIKDLGAYRPSQSTLINGLVLLFAFTPVRFLSYIWIIYLFAKLLPVVIGPISKLVLSFVLIASSNTVLAGIFWIFGLELSSGLILAAYIFMLTYCASRVPNSRLGRIDKKDVVASIIAIATMIFLMVPVVNKPNSTGVAPLIMFGGDNSAHIELVKYNDINHGYSLGNRNTKNVLVANLKFYPQGWHLNTAFTKWLIEPISSFNNRPTKLLILFYSYGVLWVGIFAYLATRLTLSLGKLEKLGPITAAATALAIPLASLFLPLFLYGFQTHIASLVVLITELFLVSETYKYRDTKKYYPLLLLSLTTAVSSAFIWLFIAPICFVVFGLLLLVTRKNIFRNPPIYVAMFALINIAAAIVQPLAQQLYGPKGGEDFINLTGFIPHTALYWLILAFVAVTIFAITQWDQIETKVLYSTGAVSLAFSIFLMEYQLSKVHELRYYYFKSNYTFILLGSILLSAAVGIIANSLIKQKEIASSHVRKQVVIFLIVAINIMFFWAFKTSLMGLFLHDELKGISPSQAVAITDMVARNPINGYHLVSIGSCNRGDDIRASLFSNAVSYPIASGVEASRAQFMLDVQSKEVLFQGILAYLQWQPEVNLVVVSNDQIIASDLEKYLGDDYSKRINLVNTDTTLETEPTSQCPDRIRTISQEEITAQLHGRPMPILVSR